MKAKTQAPSIMMSPTTGQLLLFFFPILLDIFFQQLYNIVDIVIVGSFVDTNTVLVTVGDTTGQLVNLFVSFFIGLSPGCGVITSQYYGAHDRNAVSKSVHTALTFSLVLGAVIMVLGLALTRFSPRAVSLPDEIMPEVFACLRTYLLGMIPDLFYNVGAAVFRATGNSRHPLYFLILGCLSNTVFDLVFMVSLHMGVTGATLATIFSQAASAVTVLYVLLHADSEVRLNPQELRMDFGWLKKMVYIGLPAGLRSTMYTTSNIIAQATVNSFDTSIIAAITTYGRTDVLLWMVTDIFGIAIMTFMGQNYGVGQVKRAFQGFHVPFALSAFVTLFLSTVIWFSGMDFLHFSTRDPVVLAICRRLIHYVVSSFTTYTPIEPCSGTPCGMGNSWMPMIMTVIGVCVLYLFWIFLAVPLHHDILILITAYPISWIITFIVLSLYLFLTKHRYHPKNLVKQNEKSTVI